ncbi:hypothetical protein [Bowmanella denitrificans]|uniref:hypothetical protein n=1 Tax=Bowmanella denitrificans TaxID=366582 RepID=UPI0011AF637D|nr:hypothetical protein [Bowmanella denitrificans]
MESWVSSGLIGGLVAIVIAVKNGLGTKQTLTDKTSISCHSLSGPSRFDPRLKIPGRFRALLKGGQFAGRKLSGRRVGDGIARN